MAKEYSSLGPEILRQRNGESNCYNLPMGSSEAKRKRTRSGLYALKAKVRVRGLQAIDRRTAAARGLLSWRDELLTALGGQDLSAREEWTVSATEKRPSLRSRSGAKCFEAFSVGARA